nr:proline-rich nuclear receptor coactivator 2 isoform X1 [Vulpes vulpes]
MHLSGRISNPAASSPPSARPAPATGGGAPLIGQAARRRVLIGRPASRPRFGARSYLHFVGRGGRRRSSSDAEVVSSWLVGARGFHSLRASSLPGRGGGLRRRAGAAAAAVPSLKSLGLLSSLCAEETPMLASAPRLNSADRPMKTSVLRQRKGSGRKQHLLSWAWQQGRGQVVEILRSEKQTER